MNYQNEHERQMAILEAAIPYIAPQNRHAVQMLLQADSLISLASHNSNDDYSLEAAEAVPTSSQTNIQEMLLHIRQFLTPKESDIIQTLLNFINANTLFQNYRDFVVDRQNIEIDTPELSGASLNNTTNPLQMLFQLINGLGSFGNLFQQPSSGGNFSGNTMLMDFLMSQLSPEQKVNFEQLQNIMYNKGGNE